MPRRQTRLFAVECIRRLLAVLDDPAHFSPVLAREALGRDLAVYSHISAPSRRAATAAIDAMRRGVLLIEVVEKLGADDPDYDGKLFLEQYSAQLGSAPARASAPTPSRRSPPPAARSPRATSCRLVDRPRPRGRPGVQPLAPLRLRRRPRRPRATASARRRRRRRRRGAGGGAARRRRRRRPPSAPSWPSWRSRSPSCATAGSLLRDHAVLATQPRANQLAYRPHLYAPSAAAARAPLAHAYADALDAVASVAGTPAWPRRATAPRRQAARDTSAASWRPRAAPV